MSTDSTITYDFLAPERIVFGWGRRREVGTLAKTLGRRALVICGSRTLADGGLLDEITAAVRAEGLEVLAPEMISREPEVEDVDRTAARFRERGISADDFILAVGGGAAIDLAKAVAAMLTNDQSPTVRDYLEGVGRGLAIQRQPLAVLAIPTTAGTGCEATKNAVISSYAPPFKKSLRDRRLVPRIALVDPELTVTTPPPVTAASGMDAITQLFESYLTRNPQPIPQALAMQGLKLAIPAIAEAVENGASRHARERMSHAALLSGMALANSGLGFAHGVAPALGVHCRVPHGVACALMLPAALRVNREVRQADLARMAHLLFSKPRTIPPAEAVDALVAEVEKLCDRVGVPRRLSQVGVSHDQIPAIVKSSRGSSMSKNPRDVSDKELTRILEELL